MQYIELTQGQRAIVDDEDYALVSQYKWSAHKNGKKDVRQSDYYARKTNRPNRIYMHRLILNAPTGIEVDHINHNTLDNRHLNLRLCSRSNNNMNAVKVKVRKCTSKYKGVYWLARKQKWVAVIWKNSKRTYLGYYHNEKDAALAYNKKASELFGKFALLNNVKGDS